MEQTVAALGINWFRELGPIGMVVAYIAYMALEDRGFVPRIFNKRGRFAVNGNGKKEVEELKKDVSSIKVMLEKRADYVWIEGKLKEIKDEYKDDIRSMEKHIGDRLTSIHKRIDGLS